jgi:PAS domain S-box-containing protein
MEPTVKLLKSNSSGYLVNSDNEITGKSCTLKNLKNLLNCVSDDLICIAGLDGKFDFVNTNFCIALGYSRNFILSQPYTQFIHPDDIPKTIDALKHLLIEKNYIHNFQNRYIKSNGDVINFEWRGTFDDIKKCIFATAREVSNELYFEFNSDSLKKNFETTQELFKIGFWSYNFNTLDLTWSKEMFAIYEVNKPNESIHKIEIQQNNILNEKTCIWQQINTNKKYREETIEKEHVMPSGNIKWIKETREKIFNKNGELIRIDGVSIDITEIKLCKEKVEKIIEEKDILLKELHHRVKNNMQVISSMLNLQSNLISDENLKSIFSESQQRIKSMASVHDLLFQSPDFNTINFKSYLKKLVNDIINSLKVPGQEIKLFLKTNEIKISLDKAIPLGLLINELVTNSIKHGFKNRNNGTIYVQLHSRHNSQHELLYKDDGNGFKIESKIKEDSIGMMLIENLTDQLDGQLYRKSSSERTCYKLLF